MANPFTAIMDKLEDLEDRLEDMNKKLEAAEERNHDSRSTAPRL